MPVATKQKFYFTLDHILETPLVYRATKAFLQLDPLLNCEATSALHIAALDEAHGNHEDALRAVDYAIKVDARNADAHMQRGFICHALDQPLEALKSFEQVVAINSHYQHGYGWAMLGLHLNQLERYGRALPCFEKALLYDPDSVYALHGLATALYFQKRYHEARMRLARALKQPEQTNALTAELRCRMGLTLLQLQAPKKALSQFVLALKSNKKLTEAWCGRAAALLQLTAHQEALNAATQALTLEPENAAALNVKSAALSALDRNEEALVVLDALVKCDAQNAAVWSQRGVALAKLKRFSEALECSQKAVTLDGQEPGNWLDYGFVLEKIEQYIGAVDCYRKAIICAPDQRAAWHKLGKVELQLCWLAIQKNESAVAKAHWLEAFSVREKGATQEWLLEEYNFLLRTALSGYQLFAYQLVLTLADNTLLLPLQHALHYLQTRDLALLANLPDELRRQTEKVLNLF